MDTPTMLYRSTQTIITRHILGGVHVKVDHQSHKVGVVAVDDVIILVIRGHSISYLQMRTIFVLPINTGNVAKKYTQ